MMVRLTHDNNLFSYNEIFSFFFQIKMAKSRQKKETKKQQQLNEITKICKENFIEKDGASYRKDNQALT